MILFLTQKLKGGLSSMAVAPQPRGLGQMKLYSAAVFFIMVQ